MPKVPGGDIQIGLLLINLLLKQILISKFLESIRLIKHNRDFLI